jgi:hypothetical protein
MITQRNSGSAGDLRTTSTESDDIISTEDEARNRVETNPTNTSSNFRFPKTKKVIVDFDFFFYVSFYVFGGAILQFLRVFLWFLRVCKSFQRF